MDCQGRYYTSASFSMPVAVWLQGESQSPRTADTQIAVYRTIRFAAETR